jgi:DNA-binding MarR family transcriptional regulator
MPATATTSLERLLDGLLKLSGTMAAHSRAWGAEAGGLSRGDMSVLGTLAVRGPQRAGMLAVHLQVGAPVISRQIRSLAGKGLASRHPDPDDGRAELVSLTDAGRERLAVARRAVCARLAERVETWDEHRLERASSCVEDLVSALNSDSQKEAHV